VFLTVTQGILITLENVLLVKDARNAKKVLQYALNATVLYILFQESASQSVLKELFMAPVSAKHVERLVKLVQISQVVTLAQMELIYLKILAFLNVLVDTLSV
jgi:hypothetical protein